MEKLQELTEKIYREGVEKGQAEAERIIAEAKEQAAKIQESAKEQAAAIEALAQKKAAEISQNTKNELKLYTGQALSALKSEVANILTDKLASQAVEAMAADATLIGQLAVAMANKWTDDEAPVITTEQADKLKAYFQANAKALLDKGLEIKQVNGKDAFFTIAPADGSYKVQFGQEEFEAYFKNFLRPQLVEMLF